MTSVSSSATIDRQLLRLSTGLLFVGELFSILVGLTHPDHELANNHTAVFAEYASSSSWTAIHLGQFIGIAVVIAGLLTLFYALNVQSGISGWAGRLGVVGAAATLALYGLLQAVDGVALKQAVNAWVAAPEIEKFARFSSAEAIRWLEWGSRSYQTFMLGLTLILFAIMIVSAAKTSRLIGYLMGLSGIAYLVQSWVLGSEGFSSNNTLATVVAYVFLIGATLWLLVIAWRMKETSDSSPEESVRGLARESL